MEKYLKVLIPVVALCVLFVIFYLYKKDFDTQEGGIPETVKSEEDKERTRLDLAESLNKLQSDKQPNDQQNQENLEKVNKISVREEETGESEDQNKEEQEKYRQQLERLEKLGN